MRQGPPALSADDQRTGEDARALADDTRLAVLRAVLDADHPVTVSELTEQFGLHHTAIRLHLGRLVEAGFLQASTQAAGGRGRPRLVYLPTGKARAGAVGTSYRELARLLAESVRTATAPRAVGRREGQRVAAASPGQPVVDVIVAQAERLGFEPRTELPAGHQRGQRLDVVLQHCPFQDVAAQDPDTVCQLHLGLAEGIAAGLGGAEVLGMEVHDPRRAGCRLQLRDGARGTGP